MNYIERELYYCEECKMNPCLCLMPLSESDEPPTEQQERCDKFITGLRENLQAVQMVTLVGAAVALLSQKREE